MSSHIPFDNNKFRSFLSALADEGRSLLFENALRYCAFCCYTSHGANLALRQLKKWWESPAYIQLLGHEDSNIYTGIKRELEFYHRYMHTLHLVPTLDAGCAFDMVGQLRKTLFCIDVTNNIKNKIKTDSARFMRSPVGWKKVFVEVDGKGIQFFDDGYSPCGSRKTMNNQNKAGEEGDHQDHDYCIPASDFNVYFFITRHIWLRYIECGKPLPLAFEGLLPTLNMPKSYFLNLIAHLRFYAYYREQLKLIPSLSCGDCTDYVGESSGIMTRYLVLADTVGYYNKYGQYLESQHGRGEQYQVAVYSAFEQTFHFYQFDEFQKIEPNFDIPSE